MAKCEICKKEIRNWKREGILIPINGTQKEYNAEAKPFHKECVLKNLWLYKGKSKIIAMGY